MLQMKLGATGGKPARGSRIRGWQREGLGHNNIIQRIVEQRMGGGNILHIRDYGDNEGEELGEEDMPGLDMEDEDWNRQQEEEDNGEQFEGGEEQQFNEE